MEIISKVSIGTKMDQVYLPKNRLGLNPGTFVIVKGIETEKENLFYHDVSIEKWKLLLINEILKIANKYPFENIIFTGSFLEKGSFNDIDILLISPKSLNLEIIKNEIKNNLGINAHLILIDSSLLLKGISQDPLFQLMVNHYISKKRIVYKIKPEINYKLLDLNLLKSELFIKNFNNLTGYEKFNLIRNLIAIKIFLDKKNIITRQELNKKIESYFGNISEIKENIIKKDMLKTFKNIYKETRDKILRGINGSK